MSQSESEEDVKIKNLKDKVDILDKLIQSVSRRFDYSNRYFLAILSISIIIISSILNGKPNEEIKILQLKVTSGEFYLLASLFLSLLIIVFSISYSHAVRSHDLTFKLITNSFSDQAFDSINVKDIYNTLVSSSITKTAPLAQFLLGIQSQFLDKSNTQNKKWKKTLIYFNLFIQLLIFIIFMSIVFVQIYTAYKAFYSYDNLLLGSIVIFTSILSTLALFGIMSQYILFSHKEFNTLINLVER